MPTPVPPSGQVPADSTLRLLEAEVTGVPLRPAILLAAARSFRLEAGFTLRGPAPGTTLITADHLTTTTHNQLTPPIRDNGEVAAVSSPDAIPRLARRHPSASRGEPGHAAHRPYQVLSSDTAALRQTPTAVWPSGT